jgi:RHS repeat-associated protein
MSGQEENKKYQIPFGKNQPWANTSAGGSAPSGGSGISSRKVINKDNIIETRYYLDGFELYRREVNGAIDYERTTLNISDEEKVFVRVEKKTNEPEIVRYQYDNHLGSACLELDYTGRIISYEEYHPFGTTSYRSGRSETEVSLKRYKYCGKERDEQTGFYYYGMRYYAAWLCRFVSVDPLQFEYPQLTSYNYAGNKPITHIDIEGMQSTGDEKRPDIYTVQKGDSPSKIAEQFNMSIWDLAKNNQGRSTNGSFFTDIGTGNYNEYWVEGAGTSWSLQPGDILNINSVSEQALYQTPSFTNNSSEYQFYRPLASGAAYSVGLLDPFIDMAMEGISLLLQKTGLGERVSDITANISLFAASILLAKKTSSFRSNTIKTGALNTTTKGTTGFRYVTEGEIKAIRETGFLRGGNLGKTYFTKDLYKSSTKVQQRLSLGLKPTHRIEFEILNNPTMRLFGTKVLPKYKMSGKGAEFMTKDPVKVNLINWQPLR